MRYLFGIAGTVVCLLSSISCILKIREGNNKEFWAGGFLISVTLLVICFLLIIGVIQ